MVTRALEQVGVRHPGELSANTSGQQSISQRLALTRAIASSIFWSALVGVRWLVLSFLLLTKHDL